MRIGILEAGRPPEELAAEFGSYPEMVQAWLEQPCDSYAALDGEAPRDPHSADLWVITGSRFGVYEDHAFIAPLERFIRQVFAAEGPRMFGICFGHQIIAQAMGGRVEKSDRGWGLGRHAYQVLPDAAPDGLNADELSMQVLHQDQVIEAPEGAKVFASSAFCPVAGLWYPGKALGIQGHPEFKTAFSEAVLSLRRGTTLSAGDVDRALPDIGTKNNRGALAEFLKSGAPI